jgi:sulfite reductase (NADPH) flavoprotein alpha-component
MRIVTEFDRKEAAVDAPETPDLTILYGSQSGNAEYLAHQIHESSQNSGKVAGLASMDDWLQSGDRSLRRLLVVTATHGDGNMPDNAEEFWGWLNVLEPGALEGLPYAVLAIGDSMYENFCQAGHDIDRRLQDLGAVRVVEGIDCDIDFEFSAMRWAGSAIVDLLDTEPCMTEPLSAVGASISSATDGDSSESRYIARIVAARKLSKPGSAKHVSHYELALDDGPMGYQPGDSVSIFVTNPEALVEEWITIFGEGFVARADGNRALRDVLLREVELRLPHPGLIIALARMRPDASGVSLVLELIQEGRRNELDSWFWGRDVLDVLRDLNCLDLPVEAILDTLRPLQHRDYSIASSPVADDGRVHLTVNGVHYERNGRPQCGAASAFLEARAGDGAPFEIRRVAAHAFRLPNPEAPIIMIGPGVGVAPFRAFLRHREATGAPGRNWLFFGDQRRQVDFLYEEEFAELCQRGVLTRLDAAFSRDQIDKHYVQHDLFTNADQVRQWVDEGAYIFVCGDKARMAPDVDRALSEILDGGHGEVFTELKRTARYVKDVY